MILKSLLTSIAALSLAAGAASAEQQEKVANVLVLKILEADTSQQGQTDQQGEEAYLVALSVDEIPLDKDGNVDGAALSDLTEALEDSVEWIKIDSQSFDESSIPDAVLQEFTAGELLELDELKQSNLRWRVWTPIGSIGNAGYYGYGYRRGYGYNPYYRQHYPRYGYWNGSRHYRYQPSWHSRYRGGYNNHYYYRR